MPTWLLFALAAGWTHLSSKDDALPPPNGGTQQTASQVFDIDGDGVDDVVLAERTKSPSVVWMQRTKTGWVRHVLDNDRLNPEAGGAHADIDGDGDQDLIFGNDASGDQVWWWENPRPDGDPTQPWQRRTIKSGGGHKHHDQAVGDFDGDGRLELMTWNQGAKQLLWCPFPADPTVEPWPLQPVLTYPDREMEGLDVGDVDGDGKVDLVGGGRWFRSEGGGQFSVHVVDPAQAFSRAVVGQFVEGGSAEVAFVVGDGVGRLKWYRCTGDPLTDKWAGTELLGFDVDHGHSLRSGDVDGDGHLDLFCAEMRLNQGNPDAKAWIFYGDGQGHFRTEVLSEGMGNHESRLADLDGDGDLDVLEKPYNWDTPRWDVWLNPLRGG